MDPIVNNQVPPAPSIPTPPTPPTPLLNNTQPAPVFQLDSLTKNQKFMETVKAFANYGTILSVAKWLVSSFSTTLLGHYYYSSFNLALIIPVAIYALIYSALGGVAFYFLFTYVRDFIKDSAFLSKHIYSIFTLFWIPTLVGSVIMAIFAILPVLATIFLGFGLFLSIIISFVANLVLYYFYAKTVSAKIQSYYPW